MNTNAQALGWLEEFARCVRERDLEGGQRLFAADVRAFGTRAVEVSGLPDLLTNQWRHVWFHTRAFRFLPESVSVRTADDGSLTCVLALWESSGPREGGVEFPRLGRCTVILRRAPANEFGFLAVHTHFSKTPDGTL